jgi:Fe2+ or Zn2+ uptake regulation protein
VEFKTYQREGCDLSYHAHLFEVPCDSRLVQKKGDESSVTLYPLEASMEERGEAQSSEAKDYILRLFSQDRPALTVDEVIEKMARINPDLSRGKIRTALNELKKERLLVRRRQAHNRYVFSASPDFKGH